MGWIRTWCAYLGLGQGFNESRVVEDVSLALTQQLEDLALDPVQLDVHCRAVNHQLFLKFGAIAGERKTAAGVPVTSEGVQAGLGFDSNHS